MTILLNPAACDPVLFKDIESSQFSQALLTDLSGSVVNLSLMRMGTGMGITQSHKECKSIETFTGIGS